MRYLLVVICCLLFVITVNAQAVLMNLQYNAVLQRETMKPAYKMQALGDTVSLPFIDDFSKGGVYPDASLWLDRGAYINTDYPYYPPTIGVATLDGIDEFGVPYDFTSPDSYEVADYLTSKPIWLDSLTPTDSVYLSFYYQPQGRGNAPTAPDDSLVLEFKHPQGDTAFFWSHVWSIQGRAIKGDTAFRQVIIPLKDSIYFYAGFQFRFKNWATLSGSFDHWNIDYVRVFKNRGINDTSIVDAAFVTPTSSLLNGYQQMPWQHFLAVQSTQKKSAFFNSIRNLSNSKLFIDPYYYLIVDESGTVIDTLSGGSYYINPFSYDTIPTHVAPLVKFDNPSSSTRDSAVFEIRHVLKTSNDVNKWNDTLHYFQRFYNYYAYDDGTAELGFGLKNALGGQVAYQFTPAKSDTLRGIYIYFNEMLFNVSSRTLKLTVWNDAGGYPGTVLYQEDSIDNQPVKPRYNGINGFWFYKLNTPLNVSGTIYVGFLQNTADPISVGFDRNTDSHSKIFYNVDGTWSNFLTSGSLMIRPVFGKEVPADVNTGINDIILNDKPDALIYPNPASEKVSVQLNEQWEKVKFSLYDNLGRTVLLQNVYSDNEQQIFSFDVSNIPSGFYFLRIEDVSRQIFITKKVAVSR